jgi:uncharacterized protein YraI
MRSALIIGGLMAVLAVPATARNYDAYIVSGASLVAGPGADYPSVADLSPGEPVQVHGCLEGFTWCDVSFQGYRGWFDGRLLAYPYNGVRVTLRGFGAQIGLPVVAFSVEDYWGRYYRDRPFFRDRARWVREVPVPAAERVHGPVREHGAPGPHLPPTPTLQPRPQDPQDRRDNDHSGAQAH